MGSFSEEQLMRTSNEELKVDANTVEDILGISKNNFIMCRLLVTSVC